MYLPRHYKTYLSRAMTRSMAIDHPVGDPHGGPAYGERNDPVSAIVSLGTMFAAGSAAAAAGSVTLLQGLAMTGSALSLMGSISGNAKLSKIGMVVGLVGGIGALADSAGMFAANAAEGAGATISPIAELGEETVSALGQSPVASAPIDSSSMVQTFAVPDQPSLASMQTGMASPSAVSLSPDALSTSPIGGAAATGAQAPGALEQLGVTPRPEILPQSPAAVAAPSISAPTAMSAPAAPGAPSAASPYALLDPATPSNFGLKLDPVASAGSSRLGLVSSQPGFMDALKGGDYWGAAKAAGTNLMDLAKTNPQLATMLSGAVSGGMDMLSGKNAAYIDYLEARGDLDKAQAEKIRYEIARAEQRRTQMNTNWSNYKPSYQVNPDAVQIGGRPGLVSSAMKA